MARVRLWPALLWLYLALLAATVLATAIAAQETLSVSTLGLPTCPVTTGSHPTTTTSSKYSNTYETSWTWGHTNYPSRRALPTHSLYPGYVLDPGCSHDLVKRGLVPRGPIPDCPCCISVNGSSVLPPFSTVSRPDRPTTITTSDVSVALSEWATTLTIPGEPNPVETPVPVNSHFCEPCGGSACLNSQKALVNKIEARSDSDILESDFTHPDTWGRGAATWWKIFGNLVNKHGAGMGPVVDFEEVVNVENEDLIPVEVRSHNLISHAVFKDFDRNLPNGDVAKADDPLVGGIMPLYGCIGVLIASNLGVYNAHIWEIPSFAPKKEDIGTETKETRQKHYEFRVSQFFERGNAGITFPRSPALKQLGAYGGPFEYGSYQWLEVHLFLPMDPKDGSKLYTDAIDELEFEIFTHIAAAEPEAVRHYYYKGEAQALDGDDFRWYRERPGRNIVGWQYVPESVSHDGTPESKKRGLRVWWDKRDIFTRLWCPLGRHECKPRCMLEYGSAADAQGAAGPSGSGGGHSKRITVEFPEIYGRQQEGNEAMVDSSPKMFPPNFTYPDEWYNGEHDWWSRMYHVARTHGANNGTIGVKRTDHYAPDHAVFQPFGNQSFGGGVIPIDGCTAFVVYSDKGIYGAHLWEQPNFALPEGKLAEEFPELYGDLTEVFTRRVLKMLDEGTEPDIEGGDRGPSLKKLAENEFKPSNPAMDSRQVVIWTPDKSPNATTGEPMYAPQMTWLQDKISRLLGLDTAKFQLHTYISGATAEDPKALVENPGKQMVAWQYATVSTAAFDPKANRMRGVRLWWDKTLNNQYSWCPEGKPCAGSEHGTCRRRAKISSPADIHEPTETLVAGEEEDPVVKGPWESMVSWAPEPTGSSGPSLPNLLGARQATAGTEPPAETSTAAVTAPSAPDQHEPAVFDLVGKVMSNPWNWDGDEDEWWTGMKHYVDKNGANYGDETYPVDDYNMDHAVFHWFTDQGLATGIWPMYGCTGIVVMSNRGVFLAHLWQYPTFEYDTDSDDEMDYSDWEAVYERRVGTLLRRGMNGIEGSRGYMPLAYYAKKGKAFDEEQREFIQVHIITPDKDNKQTTTVPQYQDRIDRLKDDLAEILSIDEDDIKLLTYPVKGHPQFAEFEAEDVDGNMEFYDEHPGWNILLLQYAPEEPPSTPPTTGPAVPQRFVKLWWDKKVYGHFKWCPNLPKEFRKDKVTPPPAIMVRQDGGTAPPAEGEWAPGDDKPAPVELQWMCPAPKSLGGSGRENKWPKRVKAADFVCQVVTTSTIYPYDEMKLETSLSVAQVGLKADFSRDSQDNYTLHATAFQHTIAAPYILTPARTAFPHNFTYTFGDKDWDDYLFGAGYRCQCEDGACDPFSRSCCRKGGGCAECNCADPDSHGDDCWPPKELVPACCLTAEGCPKPKRRPTQTREKPNFPFGDYWALFEYNEDYSWKADVDTAEPAGKDILTKAFCVHPEKGDEGYDGELGEKRFSWHRRSECFFPCQALAELGHAEVRAH